MMSHRDARALARAAFAQQFGREGNWFEVALAQAVCGLETGYASTWRPPGAGSFNQGAIQKGSWPGAVFTYTDTHPNADGTSTPYSISFRKYASAFDGVLDVVRVLYAVFDRGARVLPAATRGDVLGFSTELHKFPAYFEGFGATDAERIAHHHNAVVAQLKAQCAELGETIPAAQPLPTVTPALFVGCTGELVGVWQRAIGLVDAQVDNNFGPATQTATRLWQGKHGLPPSGIVCAEDLIAAGLAKSSDFFPSTEPPTNPA